MHFIEMGFGLFFFFLCACVCVLRISAHTWYVYMHIICVRGNWKGNDETVSGVNGQAVRFSKSGGPLVETLSESKSFLERQTLLIFLLLSIFFTFI